MGLPVGTIIEARLNGLINNQRVMTVLHATVVTPSTFTSLGTEMAQFLTDITSGGVADTMTTYLLIMATNYTLTGVDAQPVWPTRYVARTNPYALAGTGPSTCDAQNTHGSVLFRTPLAGKKFRMTIKPPGLPKTYAQTGALSGAGLAAFNAWGATWVNSWTSGGGSMAVYAPTIWHRKLGAGQNTTNITSALAQASVRTQYRRTVNVGR